MALVLLTLSKAIHNIVVAVLYDTVRLTSEQTVRKFALSATVPRHRIPGCLHPCVRYLDTTKTAIGVYWRELAQGRPEIAHLVVSLAELHPMSMVSRHLQPSRIGVMVDGARLFPDYVHPPLNPIGLPWPEYIRPSPPPPAGGIYVESHAVVFMKVTHVYFLDNMPPMRNLGTLKPYLTRISHFAFPLRREYGLQFPELAAVLRIVLGIPSIKLLLVVRTGYSKDEKQEMDNWVPEGFESSGVFLDDLQGFTWEENEGSIWRLAEERRRKLAEVPPICQSTSPADA
ncbi:hypothetical protein B0H19DRAFT_666711 [Mycena capillaripes]|nr:hypothetical protein B0H19DRAFT_666711 [Mycena capillaripes]